MNIIKSKPRKTITLILAVAIFMQPVLVKSNTTDQKASLNEKSSAKSKFAALTSGLDKLKNFAQNNKKARIAITITGAGLLALLSYSITNGLKPSPKKPVPLSMLANIKSLFSAKNAAIFATGALTAAVLYALFCKFFDKKKPGLSSETKTDQLAEIDALDKIKKELDAKNLELANAKTEQEKSQQESSEFNRKKEELEKLQNELAKQKTDQDTRNAQLEEQKKAIENTIKEQAAITSENTKKLEEYKKQQEELAKQKVTLEKELEDKKAEITEKERIRDDLNKELSKEEENHANKLKALIEKNKKELEKITKDENARRKEIVEDIRKKTAEDIKILKEDLLTLTNELKATNKDLNAKKTELEKVTELIRQFKHDNEKTLVTAKARLAEYVKTHGCIIEFIQNKANDTTIKELFRKDAAKSKAKEDELNKRELKLNKNG